jgi:hypothetical protein
MSNPALFTKVILGGKAVKIRCSNRSYLKVGTLDRPLSLTDLGNRKRGFAALCQWLWACIDDEDTTLTSPELVADAIDLAKLDEVRDTLIDCIRMSQPDTKAKNESSSTPAPLPASSSA